MEPKPPGHGCPQLGAIQDFLEHPEQRLNCAHMISTLEFFGGLQVASAQHGTDDHRLHLLAEDVTQLLQSRCWPFAKPTKGCPHQCPNLLRQTFAGSTRRHYWPYHLLLIQRNSKSICPIEDQPSKLALGECNFTRPNLRCAGRTST